jgi:hypothetical protein
MVLWGEWRRGPEVMALPLPKPELARGQEAVASVLEREGQVWVEGQQEYLSRMLQKRSGGRRGAVGYVLLAVLLEEGSLAAAAC